MVWPFTSTAAPPPPPPAPVQDDAPDCPVDHSTRLAWLQANPPPPPSSSSPTTSSHAPHRLSEDREISSIPRHRPSSTSPIPHPATQHPSPNAIPGQEQEERWIYPSPSSFHRALVAKQQNPNPVDMPIVVPIHNAVNERVWEKVLEWEREAGAVEGGSKLISFVGKPKDRSPRSLWWAAIGYSPPFDRHDWLVHRTLPSPTPSSPSSPSSTEETSLEIRYVIDFYTGRLPKPLPPPTSSSSSGSTDVFAQAREMPNLRFFIDCRPALDSWEGVRMRTGRWWTKWTGGGEEGKK